MHSTCLAQAQLCHPRIGYVDLSVIPLSTHKLPFHRWSILMEIMPTLLQIPDTKLMVTSKVQFLQLQHVFRQNPTNTIPHTSDDTRCLLKLLNFLLTHNLLNTSLAAPKANQIFHAANKNLILKHISTFTILLLHHSTFIYPKT